MPFNLDLSFELLTLCEQVYPYCHGTEYSLPLGFSEPVPITLGTPLPKLLEDDTLTKFGFVVKKGDKTYLVFRGTQVVEGSDRLAEWQTDFFALPMLRFGPGNVHRGFAGVWQSVAPSVAKALEGIDAKKLVITGHSLGAAIATLAWLQLGGDLVTFAGPRVGDAHVGTALWNGNAVRIVNTPDIVPLVPSDPPFRHGGIEVKVTGTGSFFDAKRAHKLESYRAGLEAMRASGLKAA
jgi:hypothetical protein